MSFFDEADEPPTAARSRRPPRPPRRPPGDHQAIQIRRAIAAGVVLLLVLLAVLGIHSCTVNARKDALRTYNDNVTALIQASNQTGRNLFTLLSSGGGSSNATRLQNQVDEARVSAESQLSRAQGLSVPDEMHPAQQNLVLALRMRRDGIADVAANIQPALGTSTNRDALAAIASDMARFYASDVVYKDYTVPEIVGALHAGGVAVGGQDGATVEGGQFLPDLGWLVPTVVASRLGTQAPASHAKPAPGLHGHALSSVSVGGTTLQTGSSNTIPASPPATFAVTFTNGGTNTESNVVVKVTVSGTQVQGQTVVPQTTPGQTVTSQVTLSTSPPPGTYTVTATVEPVPGEKNTSNNSMSFPVTFQ